MSAEGKPSSRLAGIAIGVGLVLVGAGLGWRSFATAPTADLNGPAARARTRIEQALASQARALEPIAAEAARVPELTAALNMGADRATYQDLLDNEDWWARIRSQFPLSALIVDVPLAVVGPGAGNLAESAIVRDTRQRGATSGTLPGNGRAFVVATATVTQAERRGSPPIVLIGRLIDEPALAKVSEVTGDAVGLSDGTRLIEVGGPGEPRRGFSALVGHESAAPLLIDDARVGAAWPIGGGLWMLAAFAAPPAPRPPVNLPLWLAVAGTVIAAGGTTVVVARRATATRDRAADQRHVSEVSTGQQRNLRVARADGQAEDDDDNDNDGGDAAASDFGSPGVTADAGDRGRRAPGVGRGTLPRGAGAAPSPAPRYPAGGHGGTVPMPASMAATESMPPAPAGPTLMGRYELIERIGEGGMADIFFAVARGAEDFVRHFVVKRMHPHLARHREAVNQFIDEARLQAGLVHSNIVPVFDFGKAEGEYFLALEYIHGRDVSQLVQRHVEQLGRPLDVAVAFYIVHDVLEALSFAHGQTAKDGTPLEIVHRDVSPGNVLISYRGEVKLTDFGIAKADKRISRTEVGMVKGNASFMSPEQARGELVDQRSDVFCAGLVLFYCLTGQLLYRGETTLNRLLRAAVGPATSQFGHIDQLPLPAAKALRRALAIEPDRRYPTAADFAHELAPNMAGRPDLRRLMDLLFPPALRRDLRG